jgi:protein-S-isoprenylcysteine O-methyltransferase Ste14
MTICAIIAAYVSGGWGIYGHFLTEGKVPPGMKLVSLLSLTGLVWLSWDRWQHHALWTSVNPSADAAVLVLLGVSMGLFWWAVATTRCRRLTLAFSKDQPSFIHTGGPYAWVRHPFYTSYILFWIAAAVASGSWPYWIMPAAFITLYWRAIRIEEGKFTASAMSSEYQSYKMRTGMLVPWPTGRQQSGVRT